MGLGAGCVSVCGWVLLWFCCCSFFVFSSTFLFKPLTGGSLLVFSDRCARDVTLLYIPNLLSLHGFEIYSAKFSSVQDGIYELGDTHMHSTTSLRCFSNVALETVQSLSE